MKRKPAPKPVPKLETKADPAPKVDPKVAPAKPKRRRRKSAATESGIDWYAIGLGILALITIAPYVLPLLRDFRPGPSVEFVESAGNVSKWFEDVASDNPMADLPKYVESLRATAAAEISDVAKIDETLHAEVESRLGRIGWLNWGLFNVELLKEIRRLRDAGKMSNSVEDHQSFLLAIADALEKAGQ
jgi:hypothetical protein